MILEAKGEGDVSVGELEVKFYENVEDDLIKFVVIVCRYSNKWLWVKHKERDTFEIPGGHREPGESVIHAAVRELQEETGAIEFEVEPILAYSVTGKTRVSAHGGETFGMLYFADIKELGEIHSEIEKYELFDNIPKRLTYPQIQPHLFNYIEKSGELQKYEKRN